MPLVTLLLFAAGAESPDASGACTADGSKLPESRVASAGSEEPPMPHVLIGGEAVQRPITGTHAVDGRTVHMRELHEEKLKKERRRPDYKFKKKASRSKGNRGQWKETGEGDGSGFAVGKRGGILRVPAQQ